MKRIRKYTYLPQEEIEVIETKSGQTIKSKEILDGNYVKAKPAPKKVVKKAVKKKYAKGGKVKQKFEYVNWQDISDDPKDNNKGFIYGINLIDEESGEVVDVEWFKTESLRDKAIKKYDLEEYEFESEMAKGGKLVGKQKNLDVNKNGKLDAEDFKILRKGK